MEQKKDILSEDFQALSYKEERVSLDNDNLYFLAMEICKESPYKDYMFYENSGELSIGLGMRFSVIVREEEIEVNNRNYKQKFTTNDLNMDLHHIFKNIPVSNWRAYGIANFGLAYYNYNLPLIYEKKPLMEIFIPEIEIRLKNKEAIVRAFEDNDCQKVKNLINNISISKCEEELNFKNTNKKLLNTSLLQQNSIEYKQSVKNGVEDIKQGKYEKIILSRKINLDTKLDMMSSYLLGRSNNNPARSYMAKLGDLEVIGYSPETVAEVSSDGVVSTFPLAGTRATGLNEEETNTLKKELLTDTKEIAEHAVSVKLAYKELESVCVKNSVCVTDFMSVLERGTVQHLASRLKGKLKEEYNEWHAFNALFPAVTASGIPKKQSIEAIGKLEKEPRNLYSGSILTYDSDGTLDAALVLRSAYQNSEATWLRAGAGIVKPSLPERELEETCEKLRSVSNQLIIIEEY